jgi:hypothetical protein
MTGFSGQSSGKINFSRMALRNSLSVKNTFFGSVKVFPNPASKMFYLTVDIPHAKLCNLAVRSLDGKTLISQKLDAQASWNAFAISAEKIPSGIYIIQLQSGNAVMSHKLVIE